MQKRYVFYVVETKFVNISRTPRSKWIACIPPALFTSLSLDWLSRKFRNRLHTIYFNKLYFIWQIPVATSGSKQFVSFKHTATQVCVPLTTRTVSHHATYPFHLLTVVSGILYLLATDHEQAREEKNLTFQNCKLRRINTTSRRDMIT
jgi:hypothetical protein